MGSLLQDLRYGLRMLAKSPGFTTVAVVTLALGIGANTAIFNILNALVLRDLPVWQPERLVEVSGVYRNGSKVPFSYPTFQELERGQGVFSALFGWTGQFTYNVEANRALFLGEVRAVTGNYYSALGVAPLFGRLIGPEDVAGAQGSQVAVIGYEFWERRFGVDPAVIGRAIRLEGQPFTIIGVSRKWFMGMTPGQPPEITIPVTAPPFSKLIGNRSSLWIHASGRLKDGVTIEQSRAKVQSFWGEALAATVPTQSPGQRLQSWLSMGLEINSAATGINAALRSHWEQPLQVLMGIVTLILLIACVTLANLTLARTAARNHEISVGVVLGASRWQIIRQLVTESVLLASAGALLALTFAYWGSQFLVRFMTEGARVPVILDLRPDWRTFCFAALLVIVTGLLIGLAPAWQTSGGEPASVLRRNERSAGRRTGPLGKVLMVTQIALSMVLLLGAGLLLRTFEGLRSLDPNFRQATVLEVGLYPRPGGYTNLDMNIYRRQLIERVANLPGVLSVSHSELTVPVGDSGWKETVSSTATDSIGDANHLATLAVVSPGFFRTLRVPLVWGRDFDWSDDDHHPRVAIVDASLARRLLPSGDVIGRRIRFGVQPEFQDMEIVGVARSARLVNFRDADNPVVYVPGAQHPKYVPQGNLFVSADYPGVIATSVEDAVQSLGHEYSTDTKTLAQMSEQRLLQERATAMLSSLFAVLALLLAGIGLFGLMSCAVTRRTREIGIRMALGAERDCILRMIMRESLLLTLAGVAIGLPSALAATQLIRHMLFGVPPDDLATLATVSSVLLGIGAIAGYLPAQRATKVDPMVALRYE